MSPVLVHYPQNQMFKCPEWEDPKWLVWQVTQDAASLKKDFELIKIAQLHCKSKQPKKETLKQVAILLHEICVNQESYLSDLECDVNRLSKWLENNVPSQDEKVPTVPNPKQEKC